MREEKARLALAPPIRPGWRWFAVVALICLGIVVPAILAGGGGSSQARDFRGYHAIEIRRIQSQWPAPDLRDSCTSTTPGFHLVLGGRAAAGLPATSLRLVGGLSAMLAWLVIWRVAAVWTTPIRALIVSAPLAMSSYLLGSAVWTTTDALAIGLAAATLAVGMLGGGKLASSLVAGLVGTGAVAVRQILVWTIIPATLRALRADDASKHARVWSVMLAVGLPAITVGAFMLVWGGSVPPRFHDYHKAVWNPAAITFVLASFGLFGTVLIPGIWLRLDRAARSGCLIIAVCSAAVGATPRSDYRKVLAPEEQATSMGTASMWEAPPAEAIRGAGEIGRWGGPLWEAAKQAPTVRGRSVLLVVLCGIGGWVLAGLWRLAGPSGRHPQTLLMLAVCGMSLTQCLNAQTFQRYFDPWVLLALGWMVAMALGSDRSKRAPLLAGMLTPAVIQAGGSVISVIVPAFTGPRLPAW